MSIRILPVGVLALLAVGCGGEYSDEAEPYDSSEEAAQVSSELRRSKQRRNRARSTPPANTSSGAKTELRQTADGETFPVEIPPPAPTQESGEGGPCGVITSQGVVLSCQPSTYCLSNGDGSGGTCVQAFRAPVNDG